MAIKYNTYFSNAIIGVPQVGADIDINEVNTTPKVAVGFGFTRADGNKYRYCHIAAATEAGYCVATDSPLCTWLTANGVTAPASAVAVAGDNITPGTAGSRYFELGSIAAVSANQLSGNYVVVYGGTGVGYTYRVKGNTLSAAIGTGLTRVELYEPLKESLSTDSDLAFTGSPYNNLIKAISTAGTNNTVAGIIAGSASANQFAWVCEEGIIGAYAAATLTAGSLVAIGATAGYVANWNPSATAATDTGVVTIPVTNPPFARAIGVGTAAGLGLIRIGRMG
jgi:hypothetical protein